MLWVSYKLVSVSVWVLSLLSCVLLGVSAFFVGGWLALYQCVFLSLFLNECLSVRLSPSLTLRVSRLLSGWFVSYHGVVYIRVCHFV